MKLSATGLALIKQFEGLRLEAYLCPAGVLTVGFGHTGDDVYPGMRITEAEATKLLWRDVQTAVDAVNRLIPEPLLQREFDALVSFVYNLGSGALANSTLRKLIRAGDAEKAADEFPKWIHANGKVLPGLVKRRAAERAMFLGVNNE